MRATDKKIGKIGTAIIVLLLGVGSVVLWQSSKPTKRTLQNKEHPSIEARLDEAIKQLSDPITPEQRKHLNALLDEYLKDEEPVSERQITLRNGETIPLKQYLRNVSDFLQRSEAETAETEKYLVELDKFVEFHKKHLSKESKEIDDLLARWDKVEQEITAMNEKVEAINPLVDRLHAFFGTTPNVIPEPPDDATPEEKRAFYEDLQQKMEQDPNYLRSIQPQLTGRRASQTPKTGLFHTLQNAGENSQEQQNDGTSIGTTQFRTNAHSQITSLRSTLEEQYFDVLVAPSLTSEEFDQIFSTQKERETLQRRKNEMTQHVVRNIRSLLSDKANNQNVSIVRQLITQNFDKDFAEAVIRQLQQKK